MVEVALLEILLESYRNEMDIPSKKIWLHGTIESK